MQKTGLSKLLENRTLVGRKEEFFIHFLEFKPETLSIKE